MTTIPVFDIVKLIILTSLIVTIMAIIMINRGWLPSPSDHEKIILPQSEKNIDDKKIYTERRHIFFPKPGTQSLFSRKALTVLFIIWILFLIGASFVVYQIVVSGIVNINYAYFHVIWVSANIILVIFATYLIFPSLGRNTLSILFSIRNLTASSVISKHPRSVGLVGSDFRMKVSNWGKDTIDATRNILDIIEAVGDEVLLDAFRKSEQELKHLFKELWDEETGGFSQIPGNPPSVYSTYQILAINKRLTITDFLHNRLGENNILKFIDKKSFIGSLRFVKNAFDKNTGGFYDAPLYVLKKNIRTYGDARTSVSNTHAAFNFLWNAYHESEYRNEVFRFITEECHTDGGISNHVRDLSSPSSLFFGLRVLEKIGRKGPHWITLNKKAILEFLKSSWVETSINSNGEDVIVGGFGVNSMDKTPVLLQTTFGCTVILDILKNKSFFSTNELEKLKNLFIVNKSQLFGGYKFRPETQFPPTVFVTRNALTALYHLSIVYPEFEDFYEEEKKIARDFVFPIVNPQKTNTGYIIYDVLLENYFYQVRLHFLTGFITRFLAPIMTPGFLQIHNKVQDDK